MNATYFLLGNSRTFIEGGVLDTGSQACCISHEAIEKLREAGESLSIQPVPANTFHLASGETVTSSRAPGIVNLDVRVLLEGYAEIVVRNIPFYILDVPNILLFGSVFVGEVDRLRRAQGRN
eukprot:GHVU01058555.1.p1 GENE.GHVU01058555.1~~GHVU01058555.1.p1  ORF type:complete len:122 (+),score=6.01 GHVU01058555.1:688-1053(+)